MTPEPSLADAAPRTPQRLYGELGALDVTETMHLLANVLESVTEYGIIARDLDGKVVLWNEGARRLYGYEPREIVGAPNWHLLYAPAEIAAGVHLQMLEATRRDGRWEETHLRRRKNGEAFSAHVVATLRHDDRGNMVGYLLVTKDVSADLRLIEQLRGARYYAQSLFESSIDPLATISPEGNVMDANPAFVHLVGVTREQLLGADVSRCFTDPKTALEACRRAFTEGFVRDYPLAIRHGDGHLTEVLYNASVYRNDRGQTQGIFAAVRDVTERRRYEQSLFEANRIKSEFLTGMSHELRTPLNGIIGFTEFLVDEKPGPLTARQKEYLNDVLASAGHLLQIINDILDLGRVDTGKLEAHPEIFDIGDAVSAVTALTNGNAGKKKITVEATVGEGLDEVWLDQHKFRQVLYNLLSNAVKFTDPGGSVTLDVRRTPDDRLRLQVRDTGIGIGVEDMERIFNEFEQVDSGIARRFEGAGLGLALTKRVVEFLGGSIGVESEQGKGSAFTVILPVRAPDGVSP